MSTSNVFKALACAILLSLTACTAPKLSVFSTYVTRENLASYYVNTPDPSLNCPSVGQKLFISWRLPPKYELQFPLELRLHLRFHNRTHCINKVEITTLCGSYTYSLLNQEFFETEGLLSYKIELLGNGMLIEEWRHLIWVDPIVIESNAEES